MSVLSRLGHVIRPPRYLLMPSVGVDISDTSLKYVHFAERDHRNHILSLEHWGDIDIPEDTLVRGDVKKPENLVAALQEVRDVTGLRHVRVSLPEERAYIFETEIKRSIGFKEIRGQLEFRLEENVPLSPRDSFFDYHISDTGEKDFFKVLVTVYARDTILGYYDACMQAGVIPLSFEVEAQAIARASLPSTIGGTHMIVDFGKTRTGVGIVSNGVLVYTSTIDIGGKELSSALRRQLGDKPESELTQIKNTQGLVRSNLDSAAYEALLTTVSAIKDEIALRIQYWGSRSGGYAEAQLDSIVLCGGSSNLKGLPGYLTETLDVPAQRAQVWQNAFSLEDTIPPIDRRHSFGYATAIGLALNSFVNHD